MGSNCTRIRKSQKRILIIMPDFQFGGAEKQLLMIVRCLEGAGKCADVYILNHNLFNPTLGEMDEECNRMKYVRFISLDMNGYSGWEVKWSLYNYFCTNKLCSTYSVAILFYSWLLPMVPLLKNMGIRIIYSERVSAQEIYTDRELQKLVQQCDVITANSEVAAKRIEDRIHHRVCYIRNGLEKVERIDSERADSISKILVPAAIDSRKNQLLVLRFIHENKNKNYVCRFIGRISDRIYLNQIKSYISENKLKNKVQILGFTDDMRSQYEWADIVLLPSFSEGTPNVVLEAFAYGKPIIVSDIAEERALVSDSRLRFSPKRHSEIGDCISYIEGITDEEYISMINLNSQYVTENHSITEMTASYLSLISKLEKLNTEIVSEIEVNSFSNDIVSLGKELRKKDRYYWLLCKWLRLNQEGYKVGDYLKAGNYKNIAIYGFKELGQLLKSELEADGYNISLIIDRDAEFLKSDIDVVTMNNANLDGTDAIIVTATLAFACIKEELSKKTEIPIFSLEDIII